MQSGHPAETKIFRPNSRSMSFRVIVVRSNHDGTLPIRKPFTIMETNSAPTPYMLLFRNTGPEIFKDLSADQRQQLITRWNSWFEGLLAENKAIEGQPLEIERRVVSGAGARVTDGPFPETKEAIGGYVMLMVNNLEEATAIAKQHPALAYGLIIEIRQLTPHCHQLGVTTRPRVMQMASAT
jgi:hypothetical protein